MQAAGTRISRGTNSISRKITPLFFQQICHHCRIWEVLLTALGGKAARWVSPTNVNGAQSLGWWWLPGEMTWRIPVMKFHAGVLKGLRAPIHSRVWAQSKLHQAWSRVFQSMLWHGYKQRRASPCLWLLFIHTRSPDLFCCCYCHSIGFLTSQRSLRWLCRWWSVKIPNSWSFRGKKGWRFMLRWFLFLFCLPGRQQSRSLL